MNPTAILPNIPSHEVAQWHPPGKAARILVVDDDDDLRELNAAVLKGAGYDVDTAEDGDAAWAILDAHYYYDLLITDHNMPKLTGIELLNELYVSGKSLPSILVSGDTPTRELHRHPWLQISAILPKPYTAPELLETVRQVLRVAGENREPGTSPPTRDEATVAAPLRL